jgi:uncharacterized protein YkwD
MPKKLSYRLCLAFITVASLSAADCGSSNSGSSSTPATPPLQTPVVSWNTETAPTCGSGTGVAPATMSGNALTLANLIATYRFNDALPANPINVGVAQFQAADMAKAGVVSFIGTDGEDAAQRITCSGGAASTSVGIIAVGFSTSPQAVINALMTDPNSSQIILDQNFSNSISVGYDAGYWMIILQ